MLWCRAECPTGGGLDVLPTGPLHSRGGAQELPYVWDSVEAAPGHCWDAAPRGICQQQTLLVSLWLLCPPPWPFGQGLLPPLPASSLELLSLQHRRGGESISLYGFSICFSLTQFFLKGCFFPPDWWLGRAGRAPCTRSLSLGFSRGRGRAAPWRGRCGSPAAPGTRGCYVTFHSSSSGASTAAVLCPVNFTSPL